MTKAKETSPLFPCWGPGNDALMGSEAKSLSDLLLSLPSCFLLIVTFPRKVTEVEFLFWKVGHRI
jgi:hypothetical protein